MRNTKAHQSYKTNPFKTAPERRTANVFQPDEYTMSLLISLSPKALRMLLVIASRVDPLTGLSYCPTQDLKATFSWCSSGISAAKTELLRADLVAYWRANHTFYVNPKTFRVVSLSF